MGDGRNLSEVDSMRKTPLDRILTLVRALADSVDGLTLDDMADILEKGRRTAERTRNIIALHFDLEEIEDDRKKRFRIRDSLRRHYVRPDAQELAALKAEADAAIKGGSPRAILLDSLLIKLGASFDQKEKSRIDTDFFELAKAQRTITSPGAYAPVSPEVLAAISQSIMAGLCVQFDYRPEDANESVWRRVIPLGIIHGSISYLIGEFPKGGYGPTSFRLDRMSDAKISEMAGIAPDDFNLDDWLSGSFGMYRDGSYDIALRILPAAKNRASQWRFHPHQITDDLPDGSLRVCFTTGGLQELADHLLSWAGDLVIEGPSELKNIMAKRLKAAQTALGDYDNE